MPPIGARRWLAGCRVVPVGLLGGALVHELPVDGGQDSLFAFAEPRVGLGRLRDGHDGLRRGRGARGGLEMPTEGVGGQAEDPLKLGDPLGSWRGLAGEPLRHRRLGDPQCGGKLPLGQAALGTGALQRPAETRPLLSRCHVLVLSVVEAVPIRMPDQPIAGRLLPGNNFSSCNATTRHLYCFLRAGLGPEQRPPGLLHGERP
jgi:hypothetical protein